MKKILISLFSLSIVALAGIYFVGEMVKTETLKIFTYHQEQGLLSKLIRYEKSFFLAFSESEFTVTLDDGEAIKINIISEVQHLPFKARIKNTVSILDVELSEKLSKYFAQDNWLASTYEVNLLGQLTGQLKIPAGTFHQGVERFSTEAIKVDYQIQLDDYTGSARFTLPGLQSQTAFTNISLHSMHIVSSLSTFKTTQQYEYSLSIAELDFKNSGYHSNAQGVDFKGINQLTNNGQHFNTSNEWRMASYHIDDGQKSIFTDNHLKLNIYGLSTAAFARLNNEVVSDKDIAQTLSELVSYGLQLYIPDISSQTPWGEVGGALDITLHENAILTEIVSNPFVLLDYTHGSANVHLPENLLHQKDAAPILQIGLQTGFLQRKDDTLSVHTLLEQGELIINGNVIAL